MRELNARQWDRIGITLVVSGPIDVSADHLPFFGTVPGKGRVHYGLGYSGHGVGPSWLGGQILAFAVFAIAFGLAAAAAFTLPEQRGRALEE